MDKNVDCEVEIVEIKHKGARKTFPISQVKTETYLNIGTPILSGASSATGLSQYSPDKMGDKSSNSSSGLGYNKSFQSLQFSRKTYSKAEQQKLKLEKQTNSTNKTSIINDIPTARRDHLVNNIQSSTGENENQNPTSAFNKNSVKIAEEAAQKLKLEKRTNSTSKNSISNDIPIASRDDLVNNIQSSIVENENQNPKSALSKNSVKIAEEAAQKLKLEKQTRSTSKNSISNDIPIASRDDLVNNIQSSIVENENQNPMSAFSKNSKKIAEVAAQQKHESTSCIDSSAKVVSNKISLSKKRKRPFIDNFLIPKETVAACKKKLLSVATSLPESSDFPSINPTSTKNKILKSVFPKAVKNNLNNGTIKHLSKIISSEVVDVQPVSTVKAHHIILVRKKDLGNKRGNIIRLKSDLKENSQPIQQVEDASNTSLAGNSSILTNSDSDKNIIATLHLPSTSDINEQDRIQHGKTKVQEFESKLAELTTSLHEVQKAIPSSEECKLLEGELMILGVELMMCLQSVERTRETILSYLKTQ